MRAHLRSFEYHFVVAGGKQCKANKIFRERMLQVQSSVLRIRVCYPAQKKPGRKDSCKEQIALYEIIESGENKSETTNAKDSLQEDNPVIILPDKHRDCLLGTQPCPCHS